MKAEEIYSEDAAHYLPVFARYKIILDHGEGPYVYDIRGEKYLDYLGGIAVNVLGHNHPALVQAISQQAAKMIHCSNLYYTEAQATAAAKLSEISGMDRVFFGNSGAEANEGAIKLARKYAHISDPDKSLIIAANHSFHGRTLATLTATGQPKYHEGFGPLPEGFTHVDYNDIKQLEEKMDEKTCAVILEAIQGEGGVHVPDEDYLQKVRALCDKYNALLIFDEIQCGMGRTGTFFAYQQFGVKADIVTLAKGLAGGVPIGAFMTSNKIAAAFHAGDHGTTFGGNPLACAAANVVLDAISHDGLMENVKKVGAYLTDQLKMLQSKYPALIKEVRGRGLMIGMEITKPGRDIVDDCLKEGMIINCTAGNVLRFVPPLIITNRHVDELIPVLDEVFAKY
ncbi:acetylornithine transaminase [Pectinatus haikarae]|uniref:Acetylornithine aminotransferase n=1 Tax=Pectinatus haikarae TaxID=349096 RepID=A0ABT9Y4A2_9FIRM|nr:acetylornithine transaminase [Pectinatus haikarae]MDQ0202652.1 acetylornithine/N-succinyldiaminopimelate aminotransferase [Pectinatus haikarae]